MDVILVIRKGGKTPSQEWNALGRLLWRVGMLQIKARERMSKGNCNSKRSQKRTRVTATSRRFTTKHIPKKQLKTWNTELWRENKIKEETAEAEATKATSSVEEGEDFAVTCHIKPVGLQRRQEKWWNLIKRFPQQWGKEETRCYRRVVEKVVSSLTEGELPVVTGEVVIEEIPPPLLTVTGRKNTPLYHVEEVAQWLPCRPRMLSVVPDAGFESPTNHLGFFCHLRVAQDYPSTRTLEKPVQVKSRISSGRQHEAVIIALLKTATRARSKVPRGNKKLILCCGRREEGY